MAKSKPISRAIPYPEKQTVNRTFFMEKRLGVFIRAGLFISIKTVNLMVISWALNVPWLLHVIGLFIIYVPKMYPKVQLTIGQLLLRKNI